VRLRFHRNHTAAKRQKDADAVADVRTDVKADVPRGNESCVMAPEQVSPRPSFKRRLGVYVPEELADACFSGL
jgi:hypothetical protein